MARLTVRFLSPLLLIALVAFGCNGSDNEGDVVVSLGPVGGETDEPDQSAAGENGDGARPEPAAQPEPAAAVDDAETSDATSSVADLTGLWAYGLASVRTGEPLIFDGGEHMLDPGDISYGFNLVVDREGNALSPRATPLEGGESLVVTEDPQEDYNTREYARVVSIMAPIRDAILYHFEEMSRERWLAITDVLTVNGIKTQGADVVDARAVLSTGQVYDYIASGNAEGSPVARYLEEAGLELKCLAFQGFDFTNPDGANHCGDHGLDEGSGIVIP